MRKYSLNVCKTIALSYYLLLSVMLVVCSCEVNTSDDKTCKVNENDKEVIHNPQVCDSIIIKRIMPLDFMDNADSIVVELANPYNDNVVIENSYSIRMPNDSILHTGKIPQTIITPNSSCKITISLGLDSIKYSKNKNYKFIFIGKHNETKLIYYNLLRIGTRYKKGNKYIWEPDSLVLC